MLRRDLTQPFTGIPMVGLCAPVGYSSERNDHARDDK